MTAKIKAFITRAQMGLRSPKSRSRNIAPVGITIHYGGPPLRIYSHADCVQYWKDWQKMHMAPGGLGATNGGADIAYNGAGCQHGYALAGRGEGIRSGANGNSHANYSHYAVVAIIGEGQEPTQELLDALDWWQVRLRASTSGQECSPHSRWRSTSCPGDPLRGYARSRHNKPIPSEDPEPLDPWEELMSALKSSQREALEAISNLSDNQIDELARFLKRIEDVGSSGQGVVDATVLPWRAMADADFDPGTDFAKLAAFIANVEEMDSSFYGVGRHVVAMIRLLRALGVEVDPVDVSENRSYSAEELGFDAPLYDESIGVERGLVTQKGSDENMAKPLPADEGNQDLKSSLKRTLVPVIVGTVVAAAANVGIEIDEQALTTVIGGAFTGVYYTVFRFLEDRFSWAGVFLGDRKRPTYR